MLIKNKKEVGLIAAIMLISVFILKLISGDTEKLHAYGKDKIFDSVMDNISDYNSHETYYSKIYYQNKDIDYVNTAAESIDFYMPLLIEDYDVSPNFPIHVIIYSDTDEMERVLNMDLDIRAMGLYYCGIINVLSPDNWIYDEEENRVLERFFKEGPIIHELSHLLTDIKTDGNYSKWFSEGVSLYYENKYALFEWREDLKEESSNISLEKLEKDFYNINQNMAYRKSYDIVNDFVYENGEEALQSYIEKLGQNK